MSLKIRVITPDRIVWNTSADEVVLPGLTGQLGILSNHVPLITSLDIGVLRLRTEGAWKPLVVFGGFAQVEGDEVTVVVNGVEDVTLTDLESAKSTLEEASLQLETAETDKEKIEASQNVKRATARVRALVFV